MAQTEILDSDEHFIYSIINSGSGSATETIDISSTVAGQTSASKVYIEKIQFALKNNQKKCVVKFGSTIVYELYGTGSIDLRSFESGAAEDIAFEFEATCTGTVVAQFRKSSGWD